MQNTLVEYLAQPGNSAASLASTVEVEPSTITRALRGERHPSVKLARKVESRTGGLITAKDFMSACMDAILKPASRSGEAA